MTATDVVGPKAQRWGRLWGPRAEDWALTEEQQLPTYGPRSIVSGIGRRGSGCSRSGAGPACFCARRQSEGRGDRRRRVGAAVELARGRAPEAELMVGDLQACRSTTTASTS